MRSGLWGHALFLASKMDQRTYAGVMTRFVRLSCEEELHFIFVFHRFANGLAITDPLQTLYQLMSARMPSAMKQCADQRCCFVFHFSVYLSLFSIPLFSIPNFSPLFCRWGDWRPHLAMILSNPLPDSDINRRCVNNIMQL